ncbi:MAG TPA: hypothetical protein VIH57_00110, partial [Bacteroidales bacterium]
MYQLLILFHVISSTIFVMVALVLSSRSILGWLNGWSYAGVDKVLSYIFMGLLYLTLLHGIIMYFFIDPATGRSATAAFDSTSYTCAL